MLPIKSVLNEMKRDALADFLSREGLSTSGTKKELIDRLTAHHDRDLVSLMLNGPWSRNDWNEFSADFFHLRPRRSFEEIAEQLLSAVSGPGQLRTAILLEFGGLNVADCRDADGVFEDLRGMLAVSDQVLATYLARHHGRTLVDNIVDELVTLSEQSTERAQSEMSVSAARQYVADALPSEITSSSSPPTVLIGSELCGRFEVLRKLGEGGFGAVYEVRCRQPSAVYVAKFPNRSDGGAQSLRNEVDKAKLLQHPGICRVFGLETDASVGAFILLEHGGNSLSQALRPPIAFGDVQRIIQSMAEALDYLHAMGVVHGDVSPGNTLIDGMGSVRLTDFGLSGFLHKAPAGASVTRIATQQRGFHLDFSALEVLRGQNPTRMSDQWSLARVAQWLLCGADALSADFSMTNSPYVTGGAKAALSKAMHVERSERFSSCREFASALRMF